MTPCLFAAGLAGLAISCVAFVLGFDIPILVFVISLLVVMGGGLASALLREGRPRFEDVATMTVGVIFSLWLVSRATQ